MHTVLPNPTTATQLYKNKKSGLLGPLLKLPSSGCQTTRYLTRPSAQTTDRPQPIRVDQADALLLSARWAISTWTKTASPVKALYKQALCHDSDSMPELPLQKIPIPKSSPRVLQHLQQHSTIRTTGRFYETHSLWSIQKQQFCIIYPLINKIVIGTKYGFSVPGPTFLPVITFVVG